MRKRGIILIVLLGLVSFFNASPAIASPTEPCYAVPGDIPNNTNPAVSGGVAQHGTSSNPVRAATIAIGGSITLDTTPKDASRNSTKIADLTWLYNGNPTPPENIRANGGDCFTPRMVGVSNGTIIISARYINYDGSTYITNPTFTLTVGAGGSDPGTPGGPIIPADPAENDTMCAYSEGTSANNCVDNTEGLTETGCAADPTCIEKGGCTVINRSDCALKKVLIVSRPINVPPASDLGQMMENIFNVSLTIVGIAVFVMVVYGAFLMILAGGFPQMHAQGKGIIQNAFLGAMLLLAAYVILNTINPDFVRQNGTLPAIPAQPAPQ